jgi:hypothetical protein
MPPFGGIAEPTTPARATTREQRMSMTQRIRKALEAVNFTRTFHRVRRVTGKRSSRTLVLGRRAVLSVTSTQQGHLITTYTRIRAYDPETVAMWVKSFMYHARYIHFTRLFEAKRGEWVVVHTLDLTPCEVDDYAF